MNRVFLLGNLGADPELRMTNGGQAVLNLRMATSETYLDKNKVRQEKTEWHNVTVWGKRAEALAKILSMGSRVCIEGSLRTSSYERDGQKHYRTDIVARNVLLCGGKGRTRPDDEDRFNDEHAGGFGGGGDDEIPF